MQITIDKLVYGGDGLARLPTDDHGPGKAVFVPFVLEGEVVDATLHEQKRSFARGRAETILRPSAHRVLPGCPYFQRCGGCHYQHATYAHQLEIKAAILKENLHRIAKLELECDLQIHASPEWNYRNRARLKVRSKPAFGLGYYRVNSHELLPVEECPISSPLINRGIAAMWESGCAGNVVEGIEEIEFFANADDTQLLVEAYFVPGVPRAAARQWAEEARSLMPEIKGVTALRIGGFGADHEPQRIVGVGEEHQTYRTRHAAYRVGASAFFQVNRHLIDELVSIVTDGLSGRNALDLYAGVGLFSTVLARSFPQVNAVESSQTSHSDLLYNSPKNVTPVRATTERYLAEHRATNAGESSQPDVIVVDPPRSGLGERVVRELGAMGASRLVYVSCDPATLARDLAGLLSSGYRIEQAHLVDLFPQTYHLESVFHLTR